MATELRRCGVGQLMKPNGISSDEGDLFICDRCNEDAAKFLEIQDSLYSSSDAPDGN